MRKIVCIITTFLIAFSFSSCGSQTEESVVKKPTQHHGGYRLQTETKIDQAGSYEENGIKVSVTDLSYEDVVTKLNLHIRNDTDKNLIVTTANLSVNGLMFTGNLFSEVSAKTVKNESVKIDNEWFKLMGIDVIADIEFLVKVYDDGNNEIMQSDVICVKTSAPDTHAQMYDNSGVGLFSENGVDIFVRTMQKSELSDDMEIVFYAENNTKSAITLMSYDVLVNGIAIEPTFVMSVGAEKKAVDTMVFHAEALTENNIGNFDTVDAKFRVFNEDLETVLETELLRIPLSEEKTE